MIRSANRTHVWTALAAGVLGAWLVVSFAGAASAALTGASATWAFDESSGPTASDGIGALDGAIDGATRVSDGASGGALRFDGGDRVVVADDPALRTANLTGALWVRGDPASPPSTGQIILEKGDDGCEGGGYALVVDGSHVAFRIRDREVGAMKTATLGVSTVFPSLWDGEWHFVAFAAKTDTYGHALVWIDGWPIQIDSRGIEQGDLDVADLSIGGPAKPACGDAGFTGDIDEVQLYGRLLTGPELGSMEPVVTSTLTVEDVDPGLPWEVGTVDVRLLPVPPRPGAVEVYLTHEGRSEVKAGSGFPARWELPADGRFTVSFQPFHAGETTLRVRYAPSWGMTSSEVTQTITIPRYPSSASGGLGGLAMAGESFTVGTRVDSDAPPVPSGTLELWEIVDDAPVKRASGVVVTEPGDQGGYRNFSLPGRPAGTYEFEARYLGDPDVAPSASDRFAVVVLPALQIGTVTINGGDSSTDDPVVTLETPAENAIAIQIARGLSGPTDADPPIPWVGSTSTWLTSPHLGDDMDGTRTLWVRYADNANRWSSWHSDSITLDRGLPKGTVTINGGAAMTTTAQVSLTVGGVAAGSYTAVQASEDLTSWGTVNGNGTSSFVFSKEGRRTIYVRWVSADGRQSAAATDSILVDLDGPKIGSILVSPGLGKTPERSIGTALRWSATDVAGIDHYDVYVSRNGGSPVPIVGDTTRTTFVRNLAFGNRYRILVRAEDVLGRITRRWSPTFIPSGYQESSARLAYAGSWRTSTSAAYWGDGARFARAAGATATFTAKATSIAWVAPLGPTRGSAQVFVDGIYVKTVSLYAGTNRGPRVVFAARWPTAEVHSVTLKVVGTSGHPRVDVDGFISTRPG